MKGEDIQKSRENRGWSQAELANKLDVANTQVSRWERGGNISKKNESLLREVLFDEPNVFRGVVGALSKPLWQELAVSYRKQVGLLEEKVFWLQQEITRLNDLIPEKERKSDLGAGGNILSRDDEGITNPQMSSRPTLLTQDRHPNPKRQSILTQPSRK
jgi:transcriptional regulator with XRE-family HTH domain